MYIFQIGVNQQTVRHGRACWCWTRGLRAGAAVKLHPAVSVTINSQSKLAVLILMYD